MKNYIVVIFVCIAFERIKMDYYDDYDTPDTYMCGVSKADQKIIVDLHNHFRWLIANGRVNGQPQGVNLKRLKWDHRLAEQAQYLAARGKFDLRIEPDDRFIYYATTQSIYLLMSTKNTTTSWTACITDWFEEHHDYTFGSQSRTPLVYHYKQIVWANTSFVGCGECSYYDDFTSNTRPNYPYKTLMVCNYGPPGNLCDMNGILFDPYLPYDEETMKNDTGCTELCPSDEIETDFIVNRDYYKQLKEIRAQKQRKTIIN